MWLSYSVGIYFLWLLHGYCSALNASDIYARFYLMQLWSQTGGPTWSSGSQWGASTNPCDWSGVSCCLSNASAPYRLSYTLPARDGRPDLQLPCQQESMLMALNLVGFNLKGELPPSVEQMGLEVLLLANNPGLYGTLPRTVLEAENLVLADFRNTSLACDSSSSGPRGVGASGSAVSAAGAACGLPARYAFSALGSVESGGADVLPPGATYACAQYAYRNASLTALSAAGSDLTAPALFAWLPVGGPVAATTLLLSSAGFWHYQSCICVGLPGGLVAAAGPPTLSWSNDGAVRRATCPANGTGESEVASGDKGVKGGNIAPAVFGGTLAAVGVATAVLTVACILYVVPFIRGRKPIQQVASGSTGGQGLEHRNIIGRWQRGWPIAGVPSSLARCSDDLSIPEEALMGEWENPKKDERDPNGRRATGAGTKGGGALSPEVGAQLRRLSGLSSRKATSLASMDFKRANAPGFGEYSGQEVTLVATDVEGSTELWEWQPDVMNHALALHDRLMRLTIATCCGYEITTEGDAFLVAFHDPVDAVRWALLLQSALLKLDWPPLLLEHPLCRPRPLMPVAAPQPVGGAGGASASAPLLVLFKGLSVRMGIATGVPSTVREHPVTRRMQYTGAVLRLATGIAELGSGGQVLVEPMTFKGIHNKIEELDVVEAEVQELADVVRHDTTIMGVGNPLKLETAADADAPVQSSAPRPPSAHQQTQQQQGNILATTSVATGCSGGDLTGGIDFAQTASTQPMHSQQKEAQQHGMRGVVASGNTARNSPGNMAHISVHTGSLMRIAPACVSPDSCMLQAMQADVVPSLPQAGAGAGPAATTTNATASHATALLHSAVAPFPTATGCCGGPSPPQPPPQQHGFAPNSSRLRRLADLAIPGAPTGVTGFGAPINDSSSQSNRLPVWASAWQVPSHRALMVMRNSGAAPVSSAHNASDWNASHMALMASRGSFVSHIQTMSCSNGSRSGPHGIIGNPGLVAAAQLGGPVVGDPSIPYLNLHGSNATVACSSQSSSMMLQRTASLHALAMHSPVPNNLDSSATFGGTWRTNGGGRQGFTPESLHAGKPTLPTPAAPVQTPIDQEPSLGQTPPYDRIERAATEAAPLEAVRSSTPGALPGVLTLDVEGSLLWSGRSTPVSYTPRATVGCVAAAAAPLTVDNGTGGAAPLRASGTHQEVVVMASAVPSSSPQSQLTTVSSGRAPGPLCEGVDREDKDSIDGALLMNSAAGAAVGVALSPAAIEVGATGTMNLMPRPGVATSPQPLHYEMMNVEAAAYPVHVARAIAAGSADSQSISSNPTYRHARSSAASATLGLPRMRGDNGHLADEDEELYVMLLEAQGPWSGYAASEGAASTGGGTGRGTGTGMAANSGSRGRLRSVKGGTAPSSITSAASTGNESGRRRSSGNRRFRRSDNIRAVVDSMQAESLAAGIGLAGGVSEGHMLLPSGPALSPGTAQAETHAVGRLRQSSTLRQAGDGDQAESAGNDESLTGVGSDNGDTGTRGHHHEASSLRPSFSVELAPMGSLIQTFEEGGSNDRRALPATSASTFPGGLMNSLATGSLISGAHTGIVGGTASMGTFGSWIMQNHDAALAASGRISLELQRLTMASAAGLSGSLTPIEQSMASVDVGLGSCVEAAPSHTHWTDGDRVGASGGEGGGDSGPSGSLFRGLHLSFKSAPQERISRMDTSSLAGCGVAETICSMGSVAESTLPDAVAFGGATSPFASTPSNALQEVNPVRQGGSAKSPWLVAPLRRPEPINGSSGDCSTHGGGGEVVALKGADGSAMREQPSRRSIAHVANSSRRARGLQRSAASFTALDRKINLASGGAGGAGPSGTAGCVGSDGGRANAAVVGSLGTGTMPGMAEFSFAFSRTDLPRPSDVISPAPQRTAVRRPGNASGAMRPVLLSIRAAASGTAPSGVAGAGLVQRQVWQQQQKEPQSLGGIAGVAQVPHPGESGGIPVASSGECWGPGIALRPALPVGEAVGALLSADDSHLQRRALHTSNNVCSTGSAPSTGVLPERHRLASASTAVDTPPPTERTAVPRLFMDHGTGALHIAYVGSPAMASASASTPASPALLPSTSPGYRVVKPPTALSQARGSASSAMLESRSMEDAESIGKVALARGGPGGCGLSSFHPTWLARPSGMGPVLVARHSAAGPTASANPADWSAAASGFGQSMRPGSATSPRFLYPVGPSGLMAAPAVGGTSSSSLALGIQSPVVPSAAAMASVTAAGGAGGTLASGGPTGPGASNSITTLASPVMRIEEGLLAQVPQTAMYQSLSGDEALLLPSIWPDVVMQPNQGTGNLLGSSQPFVPSSPSVAGPSACPSYATQGGQQQLQQYHHHQQQQYLSPHSHKLALLAAPHGNPKVLAFREMLGREAGMTSVANHAAKQAKDLAEDDDPSEGTKTRMAGSASNMALADSFDRAFRRQHSGGGRLGMDGGYTHYRPPFAISPSQQDLGDMAKRSSGGIHINIGTRGRQCLPYLSAARPDAVPERPESEADAASSPRSPPIQTLSRPSAAVVRAADPNPRSPHTVTSFGQLRRPSRLSHEAMRPVVQVPEIELMNGSASMNVLHGTREARDSDAGGAGGGDSSCEGEGGGGGGGHGGIFGALSIPRLVTAIRDSRDSTGASTADAASGASSPRFRRMIKRTKSRSALIKSISFRQGSTHRQGLLLAALKGPKPPDSEDVASQRQQENHHTAIIRHQGSQPHNFPRSAKHEEEGPAIGAAASGYHPLVVIDMGVHSLSVPALDMLYSNLYDGVQVIQLLPAHLKHRAAYQPPLKSQEQLAPGFFDAPGAAQALMPYPPSQPPSFPRLSLMFIQPAGYSAVANSNLEVAERSGAVFCGAVREVLHMYGAYECQEYECTFMIACNGPRIAAEAGLALQEWLLQADWPSDLLDEFDAGRVILGPSGRPLLRGFRAKVGIFTGVPLSVVPHATTGRADYFGAMVNRAARLMAGAKAGQILVDKNAGLEVLREWRQMAAAAAAPTNEVGSDARSSRLMSLPLHSALRDPRNRGSSMGPAQPLIHRGSTNGSSLTHRPNGATALAAVPAATTGPGGIGHSTTSSGSGFYALSKTLPPPSAPALQLAPSWLMPTTWPGSDGTATTRKNGTSGAGSDKPTASMSETTEQGGSGGGGMATTAITAGVSVPVPAAFANATGVECDGRSSLAAQGGNPNPVSATSATSAPAPTAVAAIMAAVAGKACLLPRAVQVVDLGEFKLKGLQRGQPVVALQLRRMRGQQGDALMQEDVEVGTGKGGGKAHQVQCGTGLIDEVAVAVALPAVLTSASPEEDINAA
ncbi:hypothetical protein Vafri_1723 [Volvox africanus]|nr:hypothetical protein Vafri_1723 [Volvox africanus]